MFRQSLRNGLRPLVQFRMISEVKFNVDGTARVVTLNRPSKLNALNAEMCSAILPTLQEYGKSDMNDVVILKSATSPRAFCSGGDVAKVAECNQSSNHSYAREFFTKEYSLNFALATFKKPVVSIMDGITMGGGVGLSTHVPFRVATENTRWAMPEMDIGFFPDVGTTFSLPKITTVGGNNGQLAQYLCMTGDILEGYDVYIAGLASHFVPHEQLQNLQSRLAELHFSEGSRNTIFDAVNTAIEEFSISFAKGYRFKYTNNELDVIEQCFDIGNSLKQIISKLDEVSASNKASEEAKKFALRTKETLLKKSPISLEIAKEMFQRNSSTDIQTALTHDLITATRMSENPNICEFTEATAHKLLKKNKTSYQWTIDNIKLSQLSILLSQNQTNPVSLIRTGQTTTFTEYPHHHKYQLPTERTVEAYITGADNQGRQTAVTKREAIKYFQQLNPITKGKTGVNYLVSQIIDRKCEPNRDGFLRWNSSTSKL